MLAIRRDANGKAGLARVRAGVCALVCSSALIGSMPAFAQGSYESALEQAKDLLRSSSYREAARAYQAAADEAADAADAADALYWKAFALYRLSGTEDLKQALAALERARAKSPDDLPSDVDGLATRIQGALARRGDASSAEAVTRAAESEGSADERMEALNALLHMDGDRAIPILRKVLARREPDTVELRKHALFLLAQHEGPETSAMLLDAAHNDPESEVRQGAVFWLSQTDDPAALTGLEEILHSQQDPEVQKSALFAIAQSDDARGVEILRKVALDPAYGEIRGDAIFWLGQSHEDNVGLLASLFDQIDDSELKGKVIFSIAQQDGDAAAEWLFDLVGNRKVDVEARKTALFWLGQNTALSAGDLHDLFDNISEPAMREQIVFVAAQDEDGGGIDFLLDLVKNGQDRAAREKALFWLGQSDDPRALQAIEDIIER
ncbi:MAG: HEAT repeat domain-containing protein [Candidatus Eisenbacteria bacterium]